MINVTKEELLQRIEALEARLDRLEGRQRGPITMTEYRLACERKDKAMMRRYLDQEHEKYLREGKGKDKSGGGESTEA